MSQFIKRGLSPLPCDCHALELPKTLNVCEKVTSDLGLDGSFRRVIRFRLQLTTG